MNRSQKPRTMDPPPVPWPRPDVGTPGFAQTATSEAFKHTLGRLLAEGLTCNTFDYPSNNWPPPTPARRYIREFLDRYRSEIRGRCVEFAPAIYRATYDRRPEVRSYDVWSLTPGAGVTIVADVQACPELPAGRFDTILCTHVLSAVRRPWCATAELHRLLAPGGLLLITVPVVLQRYAPDPHDCWRLTRDGLATLLEGFARIELHSFGNAATVAGSPYYLMEQHFSPDVLTRHDPDCPSIIAAAAWA